MKPKIFVTDGRSRATLAMAKFLDKKNIEVHVGEERWECHSFFSKYVKKRIIYPSAEKYPDKFLKFLLNHLKGNNYDAAFPVRDDTTRIFSKHKDKLSKHTNIAVPDYETLMKANNKKKLTQTAIKNNLPTPKTYFLTEDNFQRLLDTLHFPLLLRPKFGSGSRGIMYIENKKDFLKKIKSLSSPINDYLVQEYIEHKCTDQFVCPCLFNMDSDVVAFFSLRKLRQYPVSGGPMTYAESFYNKELINQTIKLLKLLEWQGMCAVEYIRDPKDGKFKITEINARYYGALGTALYAGVNFPYLMYKLAIGEKEQGPKKFPSGVKWRWLLPGDLLSYLTSTYEIKKNTNFFDFTDNNYAILSLKDSGPTLGTIVDIFYRLLHKRHRDFVFKRGFKIKE